MVTIFSNQKRHYDALMGSISHKKILTLKPQEAFKINISELPTGIGPVTSALPMRRSTD